MSALGQKQTFRDAQPMSALTSESGHCSAAVFHKNFARGVADIVAMSALGQKRTSCKPATKIKEPRLRLPGHLAFSNAEGSTV
jgi:hypothetical protein